MHSEMRLREVLAEVEREVQTETKQQVLLHGVRCVVLYASENGLAGKLFGRLESCACRALCHMLYLRCAAPCTAGAV